MDTGNPSTDTISQGPSSPCTATMHPTSLTLSLSSTTVVAGGILVVTGTLTDTCTGKGVAGATITFTIPPFINGFPILTGATGTYLENLPGPPISGTFTVQAHFAGQGIFGPSNSATETFIVV
jgi:hypothetical protein